MEETCKYCGKKVVKGNLRCDLCNLVWQDGHKYGIRSAKVDLRMILDDLKTLATLED